MSPPQVAAVKIQLLDPEGGVVVEQILPADQKNHSLFIQPLLPVRGGQLLEGFFFTPVLKTPAENYGKGFAALADVAAEIAATAADAAELDHIAKTRGGVPERDLALGITPPAPFVPGLDLGDAVVESLSRQEGMAAAEKLDLTQALTLPAGRAGRPPEDPQPDLVVRMPGTESGR